MTHADNRPVPGFSRRTLLGGAMTAGAAVLLADDEAEQAKFAHLWHQFGREVVVAIPLRDVRGDLVLGEVSDESAEVLVVLGQLEHRRPFDRGVGHCLTFT